MSGEPLNMNTFWSNIKINNCFSFSKLNYFSDIALLKNTSLILEKSCMTNPFCSSFQTQLNTRNFSLCS